MRKLRAKRQIWVPYNGKIADITEADTNKHTLDLQTALSETRKIIGVIVFANRISGTGFLEVYPNEGAAALYVSDTSDFSQIAIIADGTQRLQYDQTVANDDFDLFCFGYVVEV